MPQFEGCNKAKEISLCPKNLGGGANQHAHVLMLKSLRGGAPAESKTEKSKMPAEVTTPTVDEIKKAATSTATKILLFSETAKAYYLGLDEGGQMALLEKSSDEIEKTAADAKAAADKKKMEEEAAKAGTTAEVLELRKSNEDMRKEIEALKAKDVDRDLEKRAATEFAGYPGGAAAVVPLLKAYASLPEDVRKASEAVLVAQAKAARDATTSYGARTEEDMTKAQGAAKRIDDAAKALAKEKNISYGDAYEQIVEKAEFAADVAAIG